MLESLLPVATVFGIVCVSHNDISSNALFIFTLRFHCKFKYCRETIGNGTDPGGRLRTLRPPRRTTPMPSSPTRTTTTIRRTSRRKRRRSGEAGRGTRLRPSRPELAGPPPLAAVFPTETYLTAAQTMPKNQGRNRILLSDSLRIEKNFVK